jgi:pantoate--beta-alanine ligase
MSIARTIADCRRAVAAARRGGRRIAFVPTMGALHAGHTALMAAARRHAVATAAAGHGASPPFLVVSIFVNPTQFGSGEDYTRYPRDEAADLAICDDAGVELVFAPGVEEMYADRSLTTIHVGQLGETLCGPHRPGHFDAVATVVARLFHIVQPDAAYFGEKDYQQLAVVRRMVRDLNMPIEVVGCPTVREADGLARSSRNRYLSPAERTQAASLYRGLQAGAALVASGERDAAAVVAVVQRAIESAGPVRIDYISIVDPETLQHVAALTAPVQLALAVRIGGTRLIDNLRLDPPAQKP